MKKTTQFLLISATLAMLALTTFASRVQLHTDDQKQDECSAENKTAWYKEFLANYKGDTAKAYAAAKKYIACPLDQNDQDEVKRVEYLKTWTAKYDQVTEKANRKVRLHDLVYNKKDYATAFETGKQVLADEPDFFQAYVDLGYAGYAANDGGNKSFANDAVAYLKKAIEMIETGKTPADWKPVPSKDDALAKLNYWIAALKQE